MADPPRSGADWHSATDYSNLINVRTCARHACVLHVYRITRGGKNTFPGIHLANPKNMDQIERLSGAMAAFSKQLGGGASDGGI